MFCNEQLSFVSVVTSWLYLSSQQQKSTHNVNATAAVAEDIGVAAAAVEDIAPSSWDEEDNTQDGHDAFDDAEVEEEVVVVHRHMVTCVDNVAFHTLAQQ